MYQDNQFESEDSESDTSDLSYPVKKKKPKGNKPTSNQLTWAEAAEIVSRDSTFPITLILICVKLCNAFLEISRLKGQLVWFIFN